MKNSPSDSSVFEILKKIPEAQGIVLAFSDASSFEACRGTCEEILLARPGTRLLSLNYFFSQFLQERGIAHDCIYADTMSDEHGLLYGQAQRLAQNWFKDEDNGQDFTAFDGLRLGYCLELPMFDFFQAVLKCIVDVELYLKRNASSTILYFNPGAVANVPVEGLIDFNIFQNLLPQVCRKAGVPVFDIAVRACDTGGKGTTARSDLSPPIYIGGKALRLPKVLYGVLKNVFLLGQQVVARLGQRPDRSSLWISSQSAFNYMGARLVGKLVESGKYNLLVWNGESKRREVCNVVPHFSPEFWRQRGRRDSLKRKFQEALQESRDRLKRSTCFSGISISELFPDFFSALYCNQFPALVEHAVLVKKLLMKNRVAAIAAHSDYSVFERMTILIGNELSIPAIDFQHGLEGTQLAGTILGCPAIASTNLVWGRAAKAVKVSRGNGNVQVMGCPLYPFQDYRAGNEGMDLNAPGTLLYIGSTGGQYFCDNRMTYRDNEEQLALLLAVMKDFPAKTLVIKPRFPDPQMPVYRRLIAESGIDNVQIAETPIPALLRECDIFFTTFSTSGLEGLVLNKPGIQFLFAYGNKAPLIEQTGTRHVPFAEYGAALGLERPDPQELSRQIASIYQSASVREALRTGRIRFLEDFANLGEGDPAARGEQMISKIVERKGA